MAGFKLTDLDKQVLIQIANDGFQSFLELRKGALAKSSRSHSWRRLKDLSNVGFVRKVCDHKGETLGWTLERNAVPHLRKLIPQLQTTITQVPNYQTGFNHDLLLREIKRSFERYQNLLKWTSETELKVKLGKSNAIGHSTQIPDAQINIQYGSRVLHGILELELTRKKKTRIQAKIEKYLLTKDIDFVLYAVSTPKLGSFIQIQADEVRKRSVKVRLNQHKVPVIIVGAMELKSKSMELLFQSLEKVLAPIGARKAA